MVWLPRLLFGDVASLRYDESYLFRFRLLIVLMVAGALLTGLLLLGAVTGLNPIAGFHRYSMTVFTGLSVLIWLLLRSQPRRLLWLAWLYEALCLLEYVSAFVFVPYDELRVIWFFINIPGVFVILGLRAGWLITLVSVLILLLGNPSSVAAYSSNAMATMTLALVYMAFMSHAFVGQSMSYFQRMRAYNRLLEQQAMSDPLTGLLNTKAFKEEGASQMNRSHAAGLECGCVFIDLDHFKAINDNFGHKAGDEVLKAVAHALRAYHDGNILAGRIGGEEFALILPSHDLRASLGLAKAVLDDIRRIRVVIDLQTLSITASIGVAASASLTFTELLKEADMAMYRAKHQGRNNIQP